MGEKAHSITRPMKAFGLYRILRTQPARDVMSRAGRVSIFAIMRLTQMKNAAISVFHLRGGVTLTAPPILPLDCKIEAKSRVNPDEHP